MQYRNIGFVKEKRMTIKYIVLYTQRQWSLELWYGDDKNKILSV